MIERLDRLEQSISQLLDIEIYSATEILKSEGAEEHDKNMAVAYQMAINRAKRIVSACIKTEAKNEMD